MRRLWGKIPGPLPLRLVLAICFLALVLIGLFYLFEWAGDLLDSGGAIGT